MSRLIQTNEVSTFPSPYHLLIYTIQEAAAAGNVASPKFSYDEQTLIMLEFYKVGFFFQTKISSSILNDILKAVRILCANLWNLTEQRSTSEFNSGSTTKQKQAHILIYLVLLMHIYSRAANI